MIFGFSQITPIIKVKTNKIKINIKLDVADRSEIAMVSKIKPISTGFLIGFLYLTIDSEPSSPNESGTENCKIQKIAVIAKARLGITRKIPLSERAVFSPTKE